MALLGVIVAGAIAGILLCHLALSGQAVEAQPSIDIGEAEDWHWYWTWQPKEWDCVGDPPVTWPDYILACDPDGWSGNYPVAYWDPRWKDIVITGANQNSAPYGDYNSVIDDFFLSVFFP